MQYVTLLCAVRSHYCHLIVFFFQAEDGIRDGRVTGVQTCALPISIASPTWSPADRRSSRSRRRSRRSTSTARSEERRVGKGVDVGGGRIMKKKKKGRRESRGHDDKQKGDSGSERGGDRDRSHVTQQ